MKCSTPYCRKQRAHHRTVCHSCAKDKFKENNPEKYAYMVLRNNAKRRKKEFSLTFEEFKEFAAKCCYMTKKGIRGNGLHIDRIQEHLGYTKDNIQALPNGQNVRKFLTWDCAGRPTNFRYVTSKIQFQPQEAYPF